MEDGDKVSSTAPDKNPLEITVNEAAAVGQIQTDAGEERTEKTSPPQTEVTSPLQTAEVTSSSQRTEETSPLQTTEVTSSLQTTEITSPLQMTEVTSSPQRTEETSPPQTAEITSPLQTAEITSSPQTAEITSPLQMTEVTSSPQTAEIISPLQMTEVTSSPQRTEETSPPQTAEITSPLQTSEITSSPQTAEITSPLQMTEVTSSPQTAEITSPLQMTEVTSPPQRTEETSPPQTAEITSPLQTSEITSSPQTAEITSPLQMTEVTSSPQTAEITSPLQMTEVTSSSQTTEVTSPPQRTEETSPPQTAEITSPLQTSEITSSPQTAEITSPLQMTEVTSSPQTAEITSPLQMTEVTSSSQTTEVTSPPQTAEVPSCWPRAEVTVKTEERASPVSEAPRTSTEAGVAACSPAASGITDARVTPVKPADSASAAPAPAPETSRDLSPDAREEQESPPSDEPKPSAAPAVAPVLFQPQFPSDHRDSPSIASQAATDLNMDSLGHKDSAGFDPDVLSQSDDDFMFEMKKSPFQAFSLLNDSLGETTAARRSFEVSDSPSPDLVQDAYDGDEGHAQSEMREIKQELSLSYASDVNMPSEDRPMSLPDILKSSPMNPEKVDSGSSEGSPEFSPVHRSGNDSPNSPFSVSANNLLGLDSKILLLKEMAEVTEARTAGKAKLEDVTNSEPSLVAFDLVKETDTPPKSDVEVLSQTSVQTAHKFECLNFPLGKAQDHWDSESPSAESFSPVLDAVTQKPSSFTVEQEQRAADEGSEPEPSSEEFEFVERPPRGTADEFLEMQDSMTFTKPPSEVLLDLDRSPELEAADPVIEAEEVQNQSSHHPHTQAGVRGKADLESDFQEISPTPVIHSPVDKIGAGKQEAEGEEESQMPDLSAAAVVELLYWRNVKSSTVVFGSSLFVLLSLIYCSIISVLSYAALALLSVTLSFRIYKGVLQAIQKSDEGHPFKWLLEKDVALSSEAVQRHSDVALSRINATLKELRRLFLVEDLVDSLKFAVLMWVFTYVGSWFNGLTLLILSLVGAFIGPITYENHQVQIDHLISMLKSQVMDVLGKIQAKVPGAKVKPE